MDLKIKHDSNIPKYRQIVDKLTGFIEAGQLKVGDKLPSISQVSSHNNVAKETVVLAYKHLKLNGIIDSNEKKGFYIQTSVIKKRLRVLVLFNIMSPSKETIYNAIQEGLKEKAHLELFFHNYNFETFENIIRSKAAMFHYFIVMPHYDARLGDVLNALPPEKLIIVDRPLLKPIAGASSVHQSFKEDVLDALTSGKSKVLKYNRIVVLFPLNRNVPLEIIDGIKTFGRKNKRPVRAAHSVDNRMMSTGTLFIVLSDDLLINLLELQQQTKLIPGKSIGIISYNESALKRILSGGIATLSSDFEKMGKTVAGVILNKSAIVVRNPFYLKIRNSL